MRSDAEAASEAWQDEAIPEIATHLSGARNDIFLSLRGTRFLAYASEQATQSLWGWGLLRFTRNAKSLFIGGK